MTLDDYTVTLDTGEGRRVLAACSERELALMAESVMRRNGSAPTGFTVACRCPEAGRRLTLYLDNVALDIVLP